MNVDGQNNF